jgi:threonine/homoserine/homoserine lactone efflux protein
MSFSAIYQTTWLGLTSSFLGALPLGMLNLTILQMSLNGRYRQAGVFSLGAVLVEFGQIFLSLLGIQVLATIPYVQAILGVFSIPILVYLGIKTWRAKAITEGGESLSKGFKTGLKLSAANVMVYPFWLVWGNLFVQNQWLLPHPMAFGFFSLGASVGSLIAFLLFVFIGKWLYRFLIPFQMVINRLIALTFLGFAVYQCFRLALSY